MKVISILLRGSLEEPLCYNFGALYPVTSGEWELCIKTIGFSYEKSSATEPDLPNLNKFIRLTCNYVESLSLDQTQTQSQAKESVLAILQLKLNEGEKKLIEFENRDYFFISSPSQKFKVYISNSDGSSLSDTIKKHLHVHILLFFRRRS